MSCQSSENKTSRKIPKKKKKKKKKYYKKIGVVGLHFKKKTI